MQEDFARLAKILQGLRNWFSSALVLHGVAKFILNFARLAKFLLLSFASLVLLLGNSQACEYFAKGLQNCWMLDSFSDSLPCILDWFGKGFEALQNLDSSCNLASNLLCHGLYQVLPHSWLVLMIKKSYQKHQNLPKTD